MKNLFFTLLIGTSVLAACSKTNEPATIIRDCTGTYLRLDGKDYHVCNTEKTDSFSSGTIVTASFKKIDACTGTASGTMVCEMLHEH